MTRNRYCRAKEEEVVKKVEDRIMSQETLGNTNGILP